MAATLASIEKKVEDLTAEVKRQNDLNEARNAESQARYAESQGRYAESQAHFAEIQARFATIEERHAVNEQRHAVNEQRHAVNEQRHAVNEQRYAESQAQFQRIEDKLSREAVLNEERDTKLNLVLDVVLRINDRLADKDDVEAKVKDHEFRIRALEFKTAHKS